MHNPADVTFSKPATYFGRKRVEARLTDAAWDGPKVRIEQVYGISKHGATRGQRMGPADLWACSRTGMVSGTVLAQGSLREMKDYAANYLRGTARKNPGNVRPSTLRKLYGDRMYNDRSTMYDIGMKPAVLRKLQDKGYIMHAGARVHSTWKGLTASERAEGSFVAAPVEGYGYLIYDRHHGMFITPHDIWLFSGKAGPKPAYVTGWKSFDTWAEASRVAKALSKRRPRPAAPRANANPAGRPETLEGYLRMLVKNIEESIAQIDGGAYPQYDANVKRNIAEELMQIVGARREQKALDPNYATPKLAIRGFRWGLVSGNLKVADLRGIRTYVKAA